MEIGKSWQPFGGAGILAIVFVLGISLVLSTLLILVPVRLSNLRTSPAEEKDRKKKRVRIYLLTYFAMLGLAYLFVEIPLIQYFIVYLDHPAYAFTIVLFSILSFSGIGSLFSNRIKLNLVFPLLLLFTIGLSILLPEIISKTISSHLVIRMLLTIVFLAPLGFFMGIPFPAGIQKINQDIKIDLLVPWSWGVNGSASVISAILAALLALTLGFQAVIYIGALAYAGAWISMAIVNHLHPPAHLLSEAQK